jgi:hypothetical protein
MLWAWALAVSLLLARQVRFGALQLQVTWAASFPAVRATCACIYPVYC